MSNEERLAEGNTTDMASRELNNGGELDQTTIELLNRVLQRGEAAPSAAREDKEREIDLVAMFWHVVGKIKWLIIAAIVGALVAGVYAWFIRVPTYSATAKLYIKTSDNSAINLSDLQIGSMLTQDYQEVFKTWEVHEMVRTSLNLDYSYRDLQRNLSINNPSSTRLLYITYTDTDPELATSIANAYANAGKKFIVENMDTKEPNVFSIALVPSNANGRSKTTIVIIGFLLGTLLALAVIVITFLLDDRPRTPDEITKVTTLPVLAVVPREDKEKAGSHGTHSHSHRHSGSGHSSTSHGGGVPGSHRSTEEAKK